MNTPTDGLTRAPDIANMPPAIAVALTETKNAYKLPNPDKSHFDNRQLNLFQALLCNTDEEHDRLSNAIDLWDSVPRYSVTRQAMTKARISGQFLKKHTTTFQHRGRTYTRTISPARITDKQGNERDYYPSATEELVEHALRKLAIEQQAGYFDKPNYRSGVVFTLYALREEMKRRGHTRSYQEIVLALNVLSGSIIEITSDDTGEVLTRSAYLPSLAAVSRKKLRDDPNAKWAVQFHPLVTGSIDKVTYRQFNYHLMMSHSTQLARWLHQQLVLKYTFANHHTPFETRYSTIKRDSGLLDAYSRDRDAVDALKSAFDELYTRGVLFGYDRKDITGPRKKLLDVVFIVQPSIEYIRETKAANKRQADAQSPRAIR
ncbi:MAG: replication protein [Deltaproteobacteria bacterium]|nr:replication protein [Deltaproteobacteria bacterium]